MGTLEGRCREPGKKCGKAVRGWGGGDPVSVGREGVVSLERKSEWESARWLSRAGGRDEPERGPKASEARVAGTEGCLGNAHSG